MVLAFLPEINSPNFPPISFIAAQDSLMYCTSVTWAATRPIATLPLPVVPQRHASYT